jgi:hypothetical protein
MSPSLPLHGYVAGCFPTDLMVRATAAHPSGLHLLMLIKRAFDRRRAVTKGYDRPVVKVTPDLCAGWEMSRHVRRRILVGLEAVGLIVIVEQRKGAAPLVRFADGVVFPSYGREVPLPKHARAMPVGAVDVFDPAKE